MSAGGFGQGVVLPLSVDDTGVDSAFARILQKYQALRAKLAEPVSIGAPTGAATMGMSPASRAAAGPAGPSAWRDFSFSGGQTGGPIGFVPSMTNGPQQGMWRVTTQAPSPSPVVPAAPAATPAQLAATPASASLAAAAPAGGDMVSDIRKFINSRRGAILATYFAAREVGNVLGGIQEISANKFLRQFMPNSQIAEQLQQEAAQNMKGPEGWLREKFNMFVNTVPGLKGAMKNWAGVDVDEQGKYEAAFNAQLAVQKTYLNTTATHAMDVSKIGIAGQNRLLDFALERRPLYGRLAAAEDRFQTTRAGIYEEGRDLRAQLADAKSENDKVKQQQIESQIRVYESDVEGRLAVNEKRHTVETKAAYRDDQDSRLMTRLELTGEQRELQADIKHPRNPMFGNILSTLTGGEANIMKFLQDDNQEAADMSRANLQTQLTSMQKRYAANFKGGQLAYGDIGKLLSANTAEDPSEVFKAFGAAQREAANYNPNVNAKQDVGIDDKSIDKITKAIEDGIANAMSN